jgi:hypothetical protein
LAIRKCLLLLRKIKIKYGFEGLEEMNDVPHRHFFRFRLDLGLKFREVSRLEFDIVSS